MTQLGHSHAVEPGDLFRDHVITLHPDFKDANFQSRTRKIASLEILRYLDGRQFLSSEFSSEVARQVAEMKLTAPRSGLPHNLYGVAVIGIIRFGFEHYGERKTHQFIVILGAQNVINESLNGVAAVLSALDGDAPFAGSPRPPIGPVPR